jgi:hypothetical protein
MSTRYKGQSTTSAKSSLTVKPTTIRYKNYEIVENHLATGRIAKWTLKLMGLDIMNFPQTTIKS